MGAITEEAALRPAIDQIFVEPLAQNPGRCRLVRDSPNHK